MQVTPTLKIERFAQLSPGDLFVCVDATQSYLAMKAIDRGRGDNLILALGPDFPHGIKGPHLLQEIGVTTASFGKEFVLRLPVTPDGWTETPPPAHAPCLLISSEKVFFRANFGSPPDEFKPCFVNAATGEVIFSALPQIAAYAVHWDIVIEDAIFPFRPLLQHQA
jgi:hypothetical protein